MNKNNLYLTLIGTSIVELIMVLLAWFGDPELRNVFFAVATLDAILLLAFSLLLNKQMSK